MYHRVSDTALKLARSSRLQGTRPSTQPGGVFPYNPTRTSPNMDKSINTNNNNSNNDNNDITNSARDLQKTIHMLNLRGKFDSLAPGDREDLIDLQRKLFTSIV